MTHVDTPRRAWLDVGRAGFLSAPVLIALLAVAVPSTLYIDVVATAGPFLPWLAVSALSTLVVVALLVPVRRLVRARWPDGPGPWRAIGIYLAAGALRGLLIWGAAETLGLFTSVGLLSRVLQSAIWTLAVMGSAGILVAQRSDHRQLMQDLAHREQDLLALQTTLDERIKETQDSLVQQVQEELGPTLVQLRAELDSLAQSGDDGAEAAVEGFRTAVAEVVRPLSYALAEPVEPREIALEVASTPYAPPAERIPVSRVIAPGASAALVLALLLLTFAIAPANYRSEAVPLRIAALPIALWLGLHGLRLIARRLQLRLTLAPLLGSLAVAYVALAWVAGSVARAITSGLEVATTTFPAVAFTLVTLSPWAVSAALALQWLARRAEVRSAEAVAELEVLTAVLRRELWRERRRLALTVHGPIQSALVATAVTMSRPGFTADGIPDLVARLDQAMAHIDRSAGPPPPIEVAARDLATLWVDSATITFTPHPDVAETVNDDEALRAVVVEVMREAVSNAIRHGAADMVEIQLAPSPEGITVAVTDDGDGPPSTMVRGLGSAMFDEVALDWSFTRSGDTTRVHVALAIHAD